VHDFVARHHALLLVFDAGFLLGDALANFNRLGVVRDDLGVNPVLERRHDAAPVGVVLGVGREHELDIKRQPHLEAPNLNIAFLQNIEERHLNAGLQVGQLVDHENAPVRPRNQAEVNHPLVGVRQFQRGGLDGVGVADEVGYAHVGRGQLLGVALVAVQPGHRRGVAVLSNQVFGKHRQRLQRVVV